MILSRTILETLHPKPSEAIFSNVFPYNFRPDVGIDVISGTTIVNIGVKFTIKFGESRSSGFRDIRGAVFVSNERTNIGDAYPNSAKREICSFVAVLFCRHSGDAFMKSTNANPAQLSASALDVSDICRHLNKNAHRLYEWTIRNMLKT